MYTISITDQDKCLYYKINWVHCMKFRPSLGPTELFERERCPLIASRR